MAKVTYKEMERARDAWRALWLKSSREHLHTLRDNLWRLKRDIVIRWLFIIVWFFLGMMWGIVLS